METKIVKLLNTYIDYGVINVFNSIKRTTFMTLKDKTTGKRNITGEKFLLDFNNSIDGTGEVEYPNINLIRKSEDLDVIVVDYTKGNLEIILTLAHDLNITGKIESFPYANAITTCYILYNKDDDGIPDKDNPIVNCHILVGEKSDGVNEDTLNDIIKHELCHVSLWYVDANNPDLIKGILSNFEDTTDSVENEFLCDFLPYFPTTTSYKFKDIELCISEFKENLPKLHRPLEAEYDEFLDEIEKYFRNLSDEYYDEYLKEVEFESDDEDYEDYDDYDDYEFDDED